MTGVSLPVTRPSGRAIVVANPAARQQPLSAMSALGFGCVEMDDPYLAMAELCRRPAAYQALVLSLTSVYREELQLVSSVKQRFGHVEIWLTQIEGRQGALADAMRLGADGLLGEDGLHRIATPRGGAEATSPRGAAAVAPKKDSPAATADAEEETPINEPVLTADELRALLQEQPSFPPLGGIEE